MLLIKKIIERLIRVKNYIITKKRIQLNLKKTNVRYKNLNQMIKGNHNKLILT